MKTFIVENGRYCKGVLVKVKYGQYTSNRRRSIMLLDFATDEYVAVCTINLSDVKLEDDEVIIKNYSENEGLYLDLVKEKIIFPYHSVILHGNFINENCRGSEDFLVCKLRGKIWNYKTS